MLRPANYCLGYCLNSVLNVKALFGAAYGSFAALLTPAMLTPACAGGALAAAQEAGRRARHRHQVL